jgi:hypothetical protein
MAQKRKKNTKPKSKNTSKKGSQTSPERNLTIGGLLLTGLGVVSVLALFSSQSTTLLAGIQSLLRKGFGWGAYPLPILLLASGLLLLFR